MFNFIVAGEDEAFTIKLHYGGSFNEAIDEYSCGDVVFYNWCSYDCISFLDLMGAAKMLKVKQPVWFWFKGYGMAQFVEVCSDTDVLKMAGYIGPGRVDPPELYKPLQAVVCDDYKGNQ